MQELFTDNRLACAGPRLFWLLKSAAAVPVLLGRARTVTAITEQRPAVSGDC